MRVLNYSNMGKNYSFQFATNYGYKTTIHEDTKLIDINEAKELFNKYYSQFLKELKEGYKPELVMWKDCKKDFDYHTELIYLDNSYDTDGKNLWKIEKIYFNQDIIGE